MSDAVTSMVSADQIELVRRTIAPGATPDELKLFLYDCQRQGVHPLDRLLHFTKRGGRYVPVTSIDLLRSRASETGELAGNDDPIFAYPLDDTTAFPTAATVTVYRLTGGTRYAYSATARWDEYYAGDGPAGQMWRKMPHVMLGKVAESLALRKAFPKQLAGMYSGEEMDQAKQDHAPSRALEAARAPEVAPESPALLAAPPPEAPYQDEDLGLRNKLRAAFFAKLNHLVKAGMQDSVVTANSEKGRERRRKLLKTLLQSAGEPEPNQMSSAEWKTVNTKLDGFLGELRAAQEEPGDPGPESEPPPGVAA